MSTVLRSIGLVMVAAMTLVGSAHSRTSIGPPNLTPYWWPQPEERVEITLYLALCTLPLQANYAILSLNHPKGYIEEIYLQRHKDGWIRSPYNFRSTGSQQLHARDGSLWWRKREYVRVSHFMTTPPSDSITNPLSLPVAAFLKAAAVRIVLSSHGAEISQPGQNVACDAKLRWWSEFPRIRE
jgi:hypothetical protein